jgi:hypothetical protein
MHFSNGSQVVRRPVSNNRHGEVGETVGASQNCHAEQHHQQRHHHHQQEPRGRSWKHYNIKQKGQQSKLIRIILSYRSIVQWLSLFIVIMCIFTLTLHSAIFKSQERNRIISANGMLFWTEFPSYRIPIMYPKSIVFYSMGHRSQSDGDNFTRKLPIFRVIGYPDFGGLHILQFKFHHRDMTRHAADVRRLHGRNLQSKYHRHQAPYGPRYHQRLHDQNHHETKATSTPNNDNDEPAPRREILPDPQASQADPSLFVADGYYDDDRQRRRRPRYEKNENGKEDCRPVDWDQIIYPTCNSFHEFDFTSQALEGHAKYVGYVY